MIPGISIRLMNSIVCELKLNGYRRSRFPEVRVGHFESERRVIFNRIDGSI